MFCPRPICPGHGNRDHDQRIILEPDVSRGGGEGSKRNISGMLLQTKSINESSLNVDDHEGKSYTPGQVVIL